MGGYLKHHRPMFPQYKEVVCPERQLVLLEPETGAMWGEDGHFLCEVEPNELHRFMEEYRAQVFTDSMVSDNFKPYLDRLMAQGYEVYATKRGQPTFAKVRKKSGSYHIVQCKDWDGDASVDFLKEMREYYDYMELGVAPTASSLGARSQHYVYAKEGLLKHTAVSRACEDDLRLHAPGSIILTNQIGSVVPLATYLDRSSAFTAEFYRHPDGAGEYFDAGSSLSIYACYFARCTVRISTGIPLSPFGVIQGDSGTYSYPTQRGRYETWLWSTTVDELHNMGCDVRVYEGWGWRKITGDNAHWAEYIYDKRQNAPSPKTEKRVKRTAVGAIGRHGMGRTYYVLRDGSHYNAETDYPVIVGRRAIDLWVHPCEATYTSSLIHWQRFTVNETNLSVHRFALPYAERERLLMIHTDAVMTLEGSEHNSYPQKHSAEAIASTVGTWIWKRHHNVRIYGNGIWRSDEEPERHGRHLLEYVKDGKLSLSGRVKSA